MMQDLRRGVRFTIVTMVLFGFGYHVVLWMVGRLVFPIQAAGSLVQAADGRTVGSRLIAQKFERPDYFHPRPSGVDYNAASSGGTNYGPSNPDHLTGMRGRLDAILKREGISASQVPSEMITSSGGGLDPHIPPKAAEIQIARVARSRQISESSVLALVREHIEDPAFGFLGRARINVLELNLALDRASRSGAITDASR
jgi:K+-transporting ATPase ATPase C chain